MEFFIPLSKIPTVTHQEKGVRVVRGKPMFYEKAEVKAVRQLYINALSPNAPKEPIVGAVELCVIWCFPKGKKHYDCEYKITKPDTDNMLKLFKDCMSQVGFWKDDSQVADEHSIKIYSDTPGIIVRVNELTEQAAK